MVRVLFFGRLADVAGGRQMEIDLSAKVSVVTDLIDFLQTQNPELGSALEAECINFIVNERIASKDTRVHHGDEVAFLPPVSGG